MSTAHHAQLLTEEQGMLDFDTFSAMALYHIVESGLKLPLEFDSGRDVAGFFNEPCRLAVLTCTHGRVPSNAHASCCLQCVVQLSPEGDGRVLSSQHATAQPFTGTCMGA